MLLNCLRHAVAGALLIVLAVLAGCERGRPPLFESTPSGPTEAVQQLVDDLRRSDLDAYARHAVPPALHARLAQAWQEGRSQWPLTELPLDSRFQDFLIALGSPGAEQRLLAAYRRQFAGAHGELRTAVTTLGLFTTQYVSTENAYSGAEREHYTRLIAALTHWGQRAPLGDLALARHTLPDLVIAARATGLGHAGAMREAGMVGSLERLGPFAARLQRVLATYGLDFGQALAGVRLQLAEQSGDQAKVRLQYALAGQPIDAVVLLERREGRWYLSDLLRRAEAEASAGGGAGTLTLPAR